MHTVHGDFRCPEPNCIACVFQVKTHAAKQLEKELHPMDIFIENEQNNVKKEQFFWLMEHLLPPSPDKFKGCELIFPDTAFFEQGQCKCIIKNDEDFCLT